MGETNTVTDEELFNVEGVYDDKISPLMQQIIAICKAHRIPVVASFNYENDEERGLGLCTTVLNNFEGREVSKFKQCAQALYDPGFQAFTITTRQEGEEP